MRLAKGSGLGFAQGPKFTGAAMDDLAGELRFERGGFCAWARRVGKDMEIGERERIDELERGFMIGFGFAGENGDYVSAYGGVGEKFADELNATGIVLGAIPAMHGGEDAVCAGLKRHVEMLGDSVRAGEERDEILRDIERLDGTDAETSEGRFVKNAAEEIEDVDARNEITAPGAEIYATEDDFLEAGIAEAVDFGEDSFGRKASAFATNERDDAEGATIIATVLNLESGASVIPFPAEDGRDENIARFENVTGEDCCAW